MADGADAEGESDGAASGRRRGTRTLLAYALGVTLLLIAMAAAVVWFSRESIADDFIQQQLDEYDLPATYEIESIGPDRQVLRNLVIGDPGDPDLTIERAIVDLRIRPFGTQLGRITLESPRLKGTLGEDAISFGVLDSALFRDSGGPPGLPELDVKIVDGRARIGGAYGDLAVALAGEGKLDGGFAGSYALRGENLSVAGCALDDARGQGRITVRRGRPTLRGPLRIARITCDDPRIRVDDLRSPLALTIDNSLDGLDLAVDGTTARLAAEQFAAARSTIEGELALRDGQISLRYDLGFGNARVAHVAADSLDAEGTARRTEEGQWRARASIAGEGLTPGSGWQGQLREWERASRDTLIAPLLARVRAALAREIPGSRLAAEVQVATGARGIAIGAPSADLFGASGSRILSLSRLSIQPTDGALPRATGNFRTGGAGMPVIAGRMDRAPSGRLVLQMSMDEYRAGDSSIAIPQLAVAQAPGGTVGLAGAVRASGPLPGGFARGLNLPLKGSYDGNRLALWPDCTKVAFERLVYANLELERRGVTLCPPRGRPILTAGGGDIRIAAGAPSLDLDGRLAGTPIAIDSGPVGFAYPGALSARSLDVVLGSGGSAARFAISDLRAQLGREIAGTFSGADISLDAVPLDLRQAEGDWSYADGALVLTNGAFELHDRDDPPRFEQLVAREASLRLRDNRIVADARLREPGTDRVVTDFVVEHDLGTGIGFADLDVPGLRFGPQLQPSDITRLAFGVVAQVDGVITGTGRIDWNPDDVTSTGAFTSDDIDFAAAFGPVEGASGTIRFDDLLGLTTAPNQRIAVRSVNPGIPVEGATVDFALREGQLIAVDGGRAPFLGGTIALRGLDINIGTEEERAYIFDIEGLDAARLVERLELGNINATGVFDGSITVLFDAQGNGRIVDGLLTSRSPGGNVAYVGELTYEDLSPYANFAFSALRSLDYKALAVEIEGPLTGEIITRLRFQGIAQGEDADSNFITRRIAALPIEFRINITAPFYALVQNVRSFFDPAFVRDPRSLGLLSDDGVRLRRDITGEEVRERDEAEQESRKNGEAAENGGEGMK
ncbi:YdbH domain-containing protein [Citromicrobium bathyomarinum]|uniref:intermembrane phospholipid transport protein YdbH family protein n=1 Tax=Citromicrobium bathyomarinum TaxID=72174 RepID=UPI00315AF5F5